MAGKRMSKIIEHGTLSPMTEGSFVGWFCCAGCGELFSKLLTLEWHLEHTQCGPMLIEETHIGMFDVETCKRVVDLCAKEAVSC